MKTTFKKIFLTIAVVCAIICMGAFAAACNKDDNADAYVFTVVYPDGRAVNGKADGNGGIKPGSNGEQGTFVLLQICDVDENNTAEFCTTPVALSEDGKLTINAKDLPELAAGHKWHVVLQGVPTGYTADDLYLTKPEAVTITLKTK